MALHMCDINYPFPLGGYTKFLDTLRFLRLLHWDTLPLTIFPKRFCPHDLVEVSLHRSNLTSFWKETVGIPKLRRLDLSGSENLEQLPDLSMAVNLEELITQGCKRLKRIPESISNLTRLTKIDVSYCDDLNSYHITIRELTGRCRQIALYFSGGQITSVLVLSKRHLMN
ncbi:hypothetical protein Bca101_027648 [Brassica carinata]